MPDPALILGLTLAAVVAGLGVHLAIPKLMPVFVRYALARPNGRSSHRVPTPQGGGAPVVAAVVAVVALIGLAGLFSGVPLETARYHTLALFAAVALALMGAADDMRPMPALARFVMQAILAAVVVFAAPAEWRLFDGWLPVSAERALAVIGFVWMVNLTNFMDGVDHLLVVEAAPVSLMLAAVAAFGLIDAKAGVIAAALAGGVLGFAPHNRHPATLFLGDVGSLPIGFLLASLLFQLAATVSLAAALLLPLYFVADATATLIAGGRAGHDVTRPHRRHAYQRAVDSGWPAPRVTRVVLGLNLALAALAAACLVLTAPWIEAALALIGLAATVRVIARFRAGPP